MRLSPAPSPQSPTTGEGGKFATNPQKGPQSDAQADGSFHPGEWESRRLQWASPAPRVSSVQKEHHAPTRAGLPWRQHVSSEHISRMESALCSLWFREHVAQIVINPPQRAAGWVPRPRVQVGKLRLLQVATPAVAGGLRWQKCHCHVLWGDEAGKGWSGADTQSNSASGLISRETQLCRPSRPGSGLCRLDQLSGQP